MKRLLTTILLLLLIVLMISCSRSYDPLSLHSQDVSSCESCHLNQEKLIATAEVDTLGGGEPSGEG